MIFCLKIADCFHLFIEYSVFSNSPSISLCPTHSFWDMSINSLSDIVLVPNDFCTASECFFFASRYLAWSFASEKRDTHQHFLTLSSWPNLLPKSPVVLTSSCYRIRSWLVSYDDNICKSIIYGSSIKFWCWEGQFALLSFEQSSTLVAWPQEYNQLTFPFSDYWILVPKPLQRFPFVIGRPAVLFLVLRIWFYGL